MSKGMVGADPEELERASEKLATAGNNMALRSRRISAALDATPWHGGNADRFRHEFAGVHAKALAEAARFLQEAHQTLLRQAAEQRRASEGGSERTRDELGKRKARLIEWPEPPRWLIPVKPGLPRLPRHFFPDNWLVPMPMPWNPFGPGGIFRPIGRHPWLPVPFVPNPWPPRVPLPIQPHDWMRDVTVGLIGIGATVDGPSIGEK